MSDTVYRLFTKLINDRITLLIEAGQLMHPFQRAIGGQDGCLDNNLILTSILESSAWSGKECHFCFLDLADAFGSIPYELIWYTLNRSGLNPDTLDLIKQLYTDCHTQYKCGSLITERIPLLKGVKQGCPLSMSLFCLSIDVIADPSAGRCGIVRVQRRTVDDE